MLRNLLVLAAALGFLAMQTTASSRELARPGGTGAPHVLDDEGARSALAIDRLLPIPSWTGTGDASGDWYGASVATAGDVNGDGYSDILVGAPGYDMDRGRAAVYRGSADGPYLNPSWVEEAEVTLVRYGQAVATAGDVNGDGYSDILVGSPGYDTDALDAGRVFCYQGSGPGLSHDATPVLSGQVEDGELGASVAPAGDVDGDGFADALVGEPGFTGTHPQQGRAALHYGGGASGRARAVRQRRDDDSAPIALGGTSDSATAFRVVGHGQSAWGRDHLGMEVEVKPLGIAFNGSGTWLTDTVDSSVDGVDLEQQVTGLIAGSAYHWRVRMLFDSPFCPHTPWLSPAGNAPTETDLRSAGSTAVDEEIPLTATLGLAAPYPNPFAVSTQLRFAIDSAGPTRLAIYDVGGRRVKVLVDESLAAGTHPAVWDGRDEQGARAASGIYLARVVQGGEVISRAVVLLR